MSILVSMVKKSISVIHCRYGNQGQFICVYNGIDNSTLKSHFERYHGKEGEDLRIIIIAILHSICYLYHQYDL